MMLFRKIGILFLSVSILEMHLSRILCNGKEHIHSTTWRGFTKVAATFKTVGSYESERIGGTTTFTLGHHLNSMVKEIYSLQSPSLISAGPNSSDGLKKLLTRCSSRWSITALGVKGGSSSERSGDFDGENVLASPPSSEVVTAVDSKSLSCRDEQNETSNDKMISEEGYGWRDSLPPQLQKRRGSLHRLSIPTGYYRQSSPLSVEDVNERGRNFQKEPVICHVYLLGTAHVSKDSCVDARLLMEHVKPDCLFVELCSQRLAILEDPFLDEPNDNGERSKHKSDNKSVSFLTKELVKNNPGMTRIAALSSVLLTKIQGDYATKLGVTIGGEFREAYKVAKEQQRLFDSNLQRMQWEQMYGIAKSDEKHDGIVQNGCAVILGDRPVRLTLIRAWESLPLVKKMKLILALIWSSFKQPSEKELKEWMDSIMNDPKNDLLTKSIDELSHHFPTIGETIIKERDRYMGAKLLQTARLLGAVAAQDGRERIIVAVVGAGHCPGIIEMLESYNRCNRSQYDSSEDYEGISSPEDVLRRIVETKKYNCEENEDVKCLITDVTVMEMQ